MNVPLSKLVAARRNPRRVKPAREAHKKLVASLRAHGLLEPLVVRPENGHFAVIAGNRRLEALRSLYGAEDIEVSCVLRKVGAAEAEELSLTENFTREAMHPLDEAEAFAKFASVDRKGVNAIAAEFGVGQGYVRQRMKLAGLCGIVKEAYRSGKIDTATAEAFAAVPETRQKELWKECGGKPAHAQHVRNLIEDRWIDASFALFDVGTLPEGAVSTDLFRQTVLIERRAFMEAQASALLAEREKLVEDGWSEVVIGERAEVQGRLYSMSEPEPDLTKSERATLAKLESKREEIEQSTDGNDEDANSRFAEIEGEIGSILSRAAGRYSEEDKCRATVFLVLSPEGKVERHYRVPRQKGETRSGSGATLPPDELPKPPTAKNLSDRQRAAVHMHEAVAVRHAITESPIVRKRLLVLALHDKVTTDAIAIRHQVNATTLHAEQSETFKSEAFDTLRKRREKIDPFRGERTIDEAEAYKKLCKLPEKALDKLIETLIVDCLTGHAQRETPLLTMLSHELGVSVRKHWSPDADWLSGYQKIQLADLIGTLKGPVYRSVALSQKKSELVDQLAALFSQAASAAGGFDDPKLAERVNQWLPRTPD